LRDLSFRDFRAASLRAVKKLQRDNLPDSAAALSYYAFTSLPSILLASLGVLALLAGRGAVATIASKIDQVAPSATARLVQQALDRMIQNRSGGIAMVAVGVVLALWTATGAMNALMRGLNLAYGRRETRGFVRSRVTALQMLGFAFLAIVLVVGLLVLGPQLSGWVGSAAGMQSLVTWVWWAAEWPVLVLGLLLAVAWLLYLGPNVEHPRWRFITPGSVVAVGAWLAASGLFAFYVSRFGSYNKTWGSLSAVIVTLVWLWLSALALLLGAELNAELERSRELREGKPAEEGLLAPARGNGGT
jgi:membrane protein